jgi:hypothetical protein
MFNGIAEGKVRSKGTVSAVPRKLTYLRESYRLELSLEGVCVLSGADRCDWMLPLRKDRSAGFSKCDRGAAPRLFRPRYAGANLGHPSSPSGLATPQTPKGRLKF